MPALALHLALSSTCQTLHTLPQLQVHRWACSSGLLALLDCALLPCFCPLPVTPPCLPCPPAVQDGAVGSWVQTVPGSLSTLPPDTSSQDHRRGDLGKSPLWLLATNWREVSYVLMPGREWHQLPPQAGPGQALQPMSRTLLGCLGCACRTCRLWPAWDSRPGQYSVQVSLQGCPGPCPWDTSADH